MRSPARSLLPLLLWMGLLPTLVPAQAWTQKKPTTNPTGRAWHAMAYDSARGVTVLYGGRTAGGLLGDTWEWNGTAWRQCFPTASPGIRGFHAMAYDSQRRVVVLFGGTNVIYPANALADTWEWNGTNWTRNPASSPPARFGHAMAFDSGRGVTVLFGGSSGLVGSLYPGRADTWEYTGASWAQVAASGQPPARLWHVMAHDSQRQRVLLQGGSPSGASALDDTWEFDGATRAWTRVATGSPTPARNDNAMVFDPLKNRSILFGGWVDNQGRLNDTWEWNGSTSTWTKILPGTSPTARNFFAMAMDTGRRRAVLFGGYVWTGSALILDDQTWEYNSFSGRSTMIGSGCPGSNNLTALLYTTTLPSIGSRLDFGLYLAQASLPGLFTLGVVNPNQSLTPFGAPGCTLLACLDCCIPIMTSTGGNFAQAPSLMIPVDPALVGCTAFTQTLLLDQRANPLGLTTTNGVQLMVGF